MLTYVGKGTFILGAKTKPVEDLQPGDKVLGYYIGIGRKRFVESVVKSVKYVGKASCKYFGSLSEYVLIPDGQQTIDTTFKYIDIDDILYNVNRNIPRPIRMHKIVEDVDIYEIELKDYDVVPLLTSYMFIAFSDKSLNFQGEINAKEKVVESIQKVKQEGSESNSEQPKQKSKQKPKRKSRRKSTRKL